MPCPICGGKIPFDTRQLLMGMTFSCPNADCDAAIGLSQDSKPLVETTLDKLEKEMKGLQTK